IRIDFKRLGVEQQLKNVHIMRGQFVCGLENEFHLLAGWDIPFAAEVSALCDQIIFRVDKIEITIVQAIMIAKILIERLWPGREHDGLAALNFGHVLMVTHAVPEFLGNEWEEWVEESKRMGENEINHGQSVRATILRSSRG